MGTRNVTHDVDSSDITMVRALNTRTIEKIDVKKTRSRYNDCLDEIRKYFSLKNKTSKDAVHNLRVNLRESTH